MKQPFIFAALCAVSTAVFGGDVAGHEFFGRIELNAASRPEVIYARPVQISRGTEGSSGAPVYLHVRSGQEQHWAAHCRAYDACTVPVLFVAENWYRDVYLPQIGGKDGREQRYREEVRVERVDRASRHRERGE
jgi:hypothetical protein